MVARRAATIPLVLTAVSAALFAAAAASPFDPLAGYLGDRYVTMSDSDKSATAAALGVDQPWHVTYRAWLGDTLSGDLGVSRSFGQPVAEVIAQRGPWTLLLVALALVVAAALSLAIGVAAGLRPGSRLDRAASAACVIVQGMPPFVLAMASISVLAVSVHWFPAGGLTDAGADPTFGQVTRHLALPTTVLALSQTPWMLLAVRESTSTAAAEGFVPAALSRGIPPRQVVRRHILPSSLAPFVTILGARLPEVVVGATLVETVFAWPGIAAATVTAASDLDMPLLAALTLAATGTVMLGSLTADVTYLRLDPTIAADE